MMRDLARAILDLETQGRLSEESKTSLSMILAEKPKRNVKKSTTENKTEGKDNGNA